MKRGYFPPCFGTLEKFEAWVSAASESGIANPRLNFCLDCTPDYQEEQGTAGTCIRPETMFLTVMNQDGEEEIIGIDL